ncbi:MAG: hypothetical protein E7348_01175 [Clostridiales bacterium]|nr:hypothetical protein [Clostridiales bacterium]
MTKRVKNISILILTLLLSIAVIMTVNLISKAKTVDALFLATTENVNVETEKVVSPMFLSGRKGYAFSAKKNGEKIMFKDGVAGVFSIDFTPYSDKVGEVDFSQFAITFSSESSRVDISLIFVSTDKGLLMNVQLSNSLGRTVAVNMDGSFCNTSDKSINFSFDPDAMVVKNAKGDVVANFKDKNFLYTYRIPEALESFGKYDVEMTFDKIVEGKTAKIVIFDVCGQKLSGDTIENTSAPVIYSLPTLNDGVVGVNYSVSKAVSTFDVIDGFKTEFSGQIKVYDQLNNLIALDDDNSFVPSYVGTYSVNYIPVDDNGKTGQSKVAKFYVHSSQPEVEFVFSTPIEDMEVGVGTKLSFPKITANSKLTTQKLVVYANVLLDGVKKASAIDCTDGFNYSFGGQGVYAVEFYAQDVSGYISKQSIEITVSNIAVFSGVDFGVTYAKDAIVNLESAKCELNGASVGKVTALTVFPSGKTTSDYNVICDEEGTYTVTYSCVVNGATISTVRYFVVKNDNVSLWEPTSGLTIEADTWAPEYADFAYNGITFTTNRPVEAVYKNVLNVADNTKEDLLCELFVAPASANTQEFKCLDVILTDIYDENNVIDIRLTEDIWRRTESRASMSAMALPIRDFTNETLYSINPNKTTNEVVLKYFYTASVLSSFYGMLGDSANNNPSHSVKFYFDYEEGKVYADYASVKGYANGKLCIADLTDESYVGVGRAWKGFTTGEVKISIKMSNIAKTAHLMVLNIDGQSMSGKSTIDTTAPSIVLDYAGNQQDKLPKAIVGKAYKIFEPTSVDLIDGYSKDVQISVYKKKGAVMTEYPKNDMEFIPNEAGVYVIRYQSTDSSGNETTKEVSVNAVNYLEDLNYTFNSNIASSYSVGEKFNYFIGKISGGNGVVLKTVKVNLGQEEIELDSDNSFVITKKGNYTLTVTLSDYVSVSEPFVFNFSADYSSSPILGEVSMPDALVQGEETVLPVVDAKLYSSSKIETVPTTWSVRYGESGEFQAINGNFVPTQSGVAYLKVQAGQSQKVYKVNITTQANVNENSYLSQYIYTDADLVAFTSADKFNATAKSALHYEFTDSSVWAIARKIDVEFASFTFGVSKCNFDSVKITFRDSVDSNVSISCLITEKKAGEEVYVRINGVDHVVYASFENASAFGEFKVQFNPENNSIMINSIAVAQVERTDLGKNFTGFASGKVYVKMEIDTATSGQVSKIGISEIAGQVIIPTIKKDSIGPTITVRGEVDGIDYGEYINVPEAVAFDFMSSVKSIKVSVYTPNDVAIYSNVNINEVKPILADQIGLYTIEYTAIDTNDNVGKYEVGIKIIDYVAPEITLSGTVPTTGRVGQKITIPSMIVKDDHTATENIITYVYYIAPNANTVEIKNGEFTPEQKGLYMLVYFAQDSDGATSVQYYQVRVK